MLKVGRQRPWVWRALGAVSLPFFIGLIAVSLGFFTAILPWWFIVALLVLPMVFVAAITAPEVGIVIMLLLVCGVVPETLGPSLTIGPGTIKAHELVVVLLFAFALLKLSTLPPLGPYRSWLAPVMLIIALAVVSMVVARFFFGTPLKDVLADGRNHLGWVVVFITICLVRSPRQLGRLQWGIVFVGVIVALATLAQFVTGRPMIQNARVEDLVTLNQADRDIVRSVVGAAIYFVVFSILLVLARLLTRSLSWWLGVPLLALMLAAIIVTFGRGVWIAGFVTALLLAFWLVRWRGVTTVLLSTGIGLGVAMGALAVYKPHVVAAAADRLLSTGNESLNRNTTLGWRLEETNFALNRIAGSPFFGIGLGTAYKPLVRMNGLTITESDEVLTRYIHNSYLGLWLKFGLLGPIAVLWLIWGFVRRGVALTRRAAQPWIRSLAGATVAAFLVPAITSVTQSEWLTQTGIVFFSLMLGIQIAAYRVAAGATDPAAQPLRQAVRDSRGSTALGRP